MQKSPVGAICSRMYFIELHFSEQHWLPTRTMESCVSNFTSLMLSLTPGWLWSRLPGSISPGWSFILGDGEGLYCSERVSPVISARVRVGKEKSLVEGGEMSQLWWEWEKIDCFQNKWNDQWSYLGCQNSDSASSSKFHYFALLVALVLHRVTQRI